MIALLLFASLFLLALGTTPTRRPMKVHETQVLPRGFSQHGTASVDTILNMRIALTQSDRDGLIKALMDVSTPGNALYGQHLTKEEVWVAR